MEYFLTPAPYFGRLAWIFFVLQIFSASAGAYLTFLYHDSNLARSQLLRRIGMGLLIAGGVGFLFGILRLFNVAVLNQRIWFYLLLLIELGVAGYLYSYYRTTYPKLLAAQRASRGSSTARRGTQRGIATQNSPSAPQPPSEPRPVATTGRREARRDRKRKSR